MSDDAMKQYLDQLRANLFPKGYPHSCDENGRPVVRNPCPFVSGIPAEDSGQVCNCQKCRRARNRVELGQTLEAIQQQTKEGT